MPAPSTIDEFLDLVRKSGVVDEKRLQAQLSSLRAAGQLPPEPGKLALQLIRDGVLTHFQAEQFLQGKWRRFTIGKYKVLERLGSGGMGSVYLAEHMMMRRRVAVKVLPAAKAEDASALERFYREARAVAALDHPNIVRAYDIDCDENLHFLVMEHVDGSSLQEIIKRAGPMDVLRAAHYIRQAALGLQHAHETAGLVHRDIKPGNILVDRNGIVKVLDMGLARFFHDEEDVLTKKYDENVLGTADYLAPEQAIDSHGVDIRADLYSLGATFYFCLTGRTPFAEGSVAQKLIWHQTRHPKPLRSFRPEVPEGIVSIIDRMMAKDPNQRYQTPQEIADALAPWTQAPIPPPPENEMPQFSLAAAPRSMIGEAGLSSSTKPSSDVPPPSPLPRKNWQVSTATGTAATPQVNTPTASTTHREARPVQAPALAPSPAPATVTAPANRGPASPVQAVAPPLVTNNGARPAAPATNVPAQARAERTEATTQPAAPAPLPVEEPPEEEDFPSLGTGSTTAGRRRERTIRRPAQPGSLRLLIVIGLAFVGFVVLACLSVVGLTSWFSRGGGTSQPKERPPILVGAGGLQAALRGAKSGDRIWLQGDLLESNVSVTVPGITIEAEPGKKVTWKCPDQTPPDSKLLLVQGVANLTVRNITFDGNGKTQALILMFWRCSGTRLDNLKLRNTGQYGVMIMNCEGSEDSKVVLDDLDFQTGPGQSAIRFTSAPRAKAFLVNKYFGIRKCQFDGPGHKITTDNGNFVDGKTIDLPAGVSTIDIVK